jgi:hypothetical protein
VRQYKGQGQPLMQLVPKVSGNLGAKPARPSGVKVVSESPSLALGFLAFLHFAGISGVRLQGFEPPTRGLGKRGEGFEEVQRSTAIRIDKRFSRSSASGELI